MVAASHMLTSGSHAADAPLMLLAHAIGLLASPKGLILPQEGLPPFCGR